MPSSSECVGVESPTGNSLTPAVYARQLLDSLGLQNVCPDADDNRSSASLWARSGAKWLSGHADGPPRACPAPLAACAQGAWLALSALSPKKLDPLFEAYRLLGERAAILGLTRAGRISAGGACQLFDTSDGALALNLVREDDRELLPAWLEEWAVEPEQLAAILRQRSTATLVERARLLGLAAAPVLAPSPCSNWYRATRYAAPQYSTSTAPLVVDLSSLWAGPLCAQLLSQCGARVIKVEGVARPDGARCGPEDFYHLLNAGKESIALDLRTPAGCGQLYRLLQKADIVIEASRPRALEQMGINAADLLALRPGMVWLSITGYGRDTPMRDWIAYGDDAGVAAGLSWLMGGDRGDPVFCGDAIADPLTGLHAALLAQAAWRNGGGQLLELTLRDVVAHCISSGSEPTHHTQLASEASKPVAREVSARAAGLGVDTARVLSEFA